MWRSVSVGCAPNLAPATRLHATRLGRELILTEGTVTASNVGHARLVLTLGAFHEEDSVLLAARPGHGTSRAGDGDRPRIEELRRHLPEWGGAGLGIRYAPGHRGGEPPGGQAR